MAACSEGMLSDSVKQSSVRRYAGLKVDSPALVIGLGKTGYSCARFLESQGVSVIVTDDRAHPPELSLLRHEFPGVPVFTGGFSTKALESCAQVVVSPGVPLREPYIRQALTRGMPVCGDIELFARCATAPVVAVTGSNGKSTVTALCGEMARRAGWDVRVGGNFGVPALDLLGDTDPDLYVLELSSFQLETTFSLNAKASVILNLSADHMDRYHDLNEYMRAKLRVHHGNGTIVFNHDDALLRNCMPPTRRLVGFSASPPAVGDFGLVEHAGARWLARGDRLLLAVRELRIKGVHNATNALAALALGEAVGLPMDAMLEALREFRGLPHRMEWLAHDRGVEWYNDSKGTNVGATLAAIRGLKGKVVLIAGGISKDADFSPLRTALAEKGRAVVLIGRDAAVIENALRGVVPTAHAASMREAVEKARQAALPTDNVLFSPACASFDMFRNYAHRGEAFAAAVQELLT